MASDEDELLLADTLSSALARVLDLLKFGETKNGALLAFSSAWILAVIGLLSRAAYLPKLIAVSLLLSIPLLAASALLALWSLLPKLTIARFHRDPAQPPSMLFFGDIATFDTAAYAARVKERYAEADNIVNDLAIQVSVNSKIARRKFKLFNVGAAFALVALIMLGAVAAIDAITLLCGGAAP